MSLALHAACRLIKEDPSGLIAVDKGIGVLSHPNGPRADEGALAPFPYDPEAEAYVDGSHYWYLINRLDAPTSGVILLSADRAAAAAAKSAFAEHTVEKCYAALIKGLPPRGKEQWRDYLVTRRKRGALRTESIRGRPNASTRMELVDRGNGPPARALVALYPETGRTHQLRVQCAVRRLPIVGDATYGDFKFNRSWKQRSGEGRLYLHSWKTRLTLELAGKKQQFSAESPLPKAFTVALD